MRARALWLAGGVWLTLPLFAVWLPPDVPTALKLLTAALLVIAAAHPLSGLGALALIGPVVVPLTSLAGPVPWGGNETLEALVLATTAGIVWRWCVTLPPAAGRLGAPASVVAAVIAATSIVLLSVQQLTVAPMPEFLAACWTHLTRDFFLDPRAFPAWHAAAVWIEGLTLAVIIERVTRATPTAAVRLALLAAIGLGVEATFSLQRLWDIAQRSDDVIAALWHHGRMTRITPHFPDLNAIGSLLAMGVVVWVAAALAPAVSRLERTGAVMAAVVMTLALWLTGSRAAHGAAVVGVLVALAAAHRLTRMRLAVALGIVCLGMAGLAALSPTRAAQSGVSDSMFVRGEMAAVGWRLARTAPAFGIGIGEFRSASTTEVTPELVARFPQARVGENAHNQLIQIGTELGAIGLLAVGWLIWATLVPALQACVRGLDAGRRIPAAGWTGAVVAFLLSSLLGHPWLTPYVLIHSLAAMGMVAGLTAVSGPSIPGGTRRGFVVAATLVVLVVSLPFRITAARAAADLDHRVIGASAVAGDIEGVPYRLVDASSTWFVRATARVIEIPLRTEGIGTCDVGVDVDRQPANRVQVTNQRWETVRFTFREIETRWTTRRIDIRVADGSCRVLVGRFSVID